MGLLTSGKALSWEDTKKNADLVRKVGIQQLAAHYHRLKDRTNDQLKFGDEVINFKDDLLNGQANKIL